jgi:hypothetical protein
LNYPLSQIYPNRYPTLRALKFDWYTISISNSRSYIDNPTL